jgi:dTDP-4-dehydrorhamnose 3,5-epimerase-like enzyme
MRGQSWKRGLPRHANTLDDVYLVSLSRFTDDRGSLSFVEGGTHIPFTIERVFYIYDVPSGATRAGHAHHVLEQFIVAMSGSFTVSVRTPSEARRFHLLKPFEGLYVPPMIWRDIEEFSSGSVALVLASTAYDETDYFEDYPTYVDVYTAIASAEKTIASTQHNPEPGDGLAQRGRSNV